MSEIPFGEEIQLSIAKYAIVDPEFAASCARIEVPRNVFSSSIVGSIFALAQEYFVNTGAVPGPDTICQLMADAFSEGRRGFSQDDMAIFSGTLSSILDANGVAPSYLIDRIRRFTHIRMVAMLVEELSLLLEKRGWDSDRMIMLIEDKLAEIKAKGDLVTAESLLDDVRDDGYGSLICKTGIPNIDAQLGGGFKIGNFGVIVGYTSVGKSWAASHLAKMTARLGYSPLIIDLERPNSTVRARLKTCLTGMTPEQYRHNSAGGRQIMELSMVRNSKIFLLNEDEKSMSVDRLPIIMDNIADRYGIRPKMIIIDSADDLAPPTTYRGKDKIERLTSIYTWLKNYSKDVNNNVCVVTTSQAQRKAEGVEWIKGSNIGDDINKVRKATVGISMNSKPDEINKRLIRYYLFKNTDGPVGAKAWARTGYHIGQLFTVAEPYNAAVYREVQRLADQTKTARRRGSGS